LLFVTSRLDGAGAVARFKRVRSAGRGNYGDRRVADASNAAPLTESPCGVRSNSVPAIKTRTTECAGRTVRQRRNRRDTFLHLPPYDQTQFRQGIRQDIGRTGARYGRGEYVDIIDYATPCAEIIRPEPIRDQIFLEFFIQ
jgi:hypothetical protein